MNPEHKKHQENDYTQKYRKIKSLKISDSENLKSRLNIATCYVEKQDKEDSRFLVGNDASKKTVKQHL